MFGCDYCEDDFSDNKDRLEHELSEHEDEMSGHEKSEKKGSLNRLTQEKEVEKQKRRKKLKYGSIATLSIVLLAGTAFTVAENLEALSPESNASVGVGSPVHWHADYDITVCGDERVPTGGPKLAHTHGEKEFHLEGVRRSREEATLDWVLDNLGANFSNSSIYGESSCNGQPANLTVIANGETIENPEDYIIRDGDSIDIDLE
jgi:hypothetical protein